MARLFPDIPKTSLKTLVDLRDINGCQALGPCSFWHLSGDYSDVAWGKAPWRINMDQWLNAVVPSGNLT